MSLMLIGCFVTVEDGDVSLGGGTDVSRPKEGYAPCVCHEARTVVPEVEVHQRHFDDTGTNYNTLP